MTLDEVHQAERDALEEGWQWLKDHGPENPHHSDFFDRWLARVHQYQRLYDMDRSEAVQGRLDDGLGVIARVKARRQSKDSPFAGLSRHSIRRGKHATDR